MSKPNSIRAAANVLFLQYLPTRAEVGDKVFRKNVIGAIAEKFECTIGAASTHYNHAFQRIKEGEPELVAGLGRAEGKNNGGRKRKPAESPAAAGLLANMLLARGNNEVPITLTAAEVVPAPAPATPEQTVFEVKRKSDGEVVASGLSYDAARDMVNKAAAAKKAKLYWI